MDMIYRDTPVGFHRLNPGPLDDQEEFSGNAELFNYLNSGTAYYGQRILVKYGFYDQFCILKKGKGNVIVPVIETPPGIELIFKTLNNKKYVLVLYFNDDPLGVPSGKNEQMICFTKPFYYALLPQCSLFANNNTAINYILEINDEVMNFTQGNPMDVVSTNAVKSVFDRARENFLQNYIVRLWVQCDDYYKAMGV